MIEEYQEQPGFNNLPGFVKDRPENNPSYIQKCCEAYPNWAELIRDTDRKLNEIVPGYNISQIKDKFGGMRYYIGFPDNTSDEARTKAWDIIDDAESKSFKV